MRIIGKADVLLKKRTKTGGIVPAKGDQVFTVIGKKRHDKMTRFPMKKDGFLRIGFLAIHLETKPDGRVHRLVLAVSQLRGMTAKESSLEDKVSSIEEGAMASMGGIRR